ncbi:hypothetical protein LSH36_609g01081 [Paralvinella palmiformis]|uniref:Uncharacterized protein n=1 Tax=Paralvinella palmiformis TaxID=53620 RepID=A0AAD9J4D6_9ANNE|nr:hypothetical protein LSH36_609g01081 [Paralvinella palmiformis]
MTNRLYITLVCLLVAASADNDVYIFNNGNCPNNNCCDGLTCSCDESQIMDIVNNNTVAGPTTAAYSGPSVIDANDLTNKETVGREPSQDPDTCTKCDHKQDWMAVYAKAFTVDGVIYQVEWAMNNDCGDKSAQSLKYGTTNSKILFGIAESSNPSSCAFKVLGYVAKNRMDDNSWDNFLKTQTTNMPQTTLIRSVTLTPADHIAMGLKAVDANGNFNLKDKHFIYAYQDGGTVCYQKWNSAFQNGPAMHCMGATQGNLASNVGKTIDLAAETRTRRQYRQYSLIARAGQY